MKHTSVGQIITGAPEAIQQVVVTGTRLVKDYAQLAVGDRDAAIESMRQHTVDNLHLLMTIGQFWRGSGMQGMAAKRGKPFATPEIGSALSKSKIDRAAFKTEREAYWKNEAQNNPEQYSAEDIGRMQRGRAPVGSDGYPMELHHIDRTPEGGLQPMTRTDHRLGENYKLNHPD